MAQDQAAAEIPVEKSSKKLLLILGCALLLLAAAGGGAWYYNQLEAGPATTEQEPPKPPIFVSLETFTVNLQPDPTEQFLQVELTLQLADETEAQLVRQHMPEVRNRLLMLLTSKRSSDISTMDGKKKLGQEISAQLKQAFTAGSKLQRAPEVFFTSFVIQ